MGLRGDNIPDRRRKTRYGVNPIKGREKRKAAGKKAITQSDRAANRLRIAKAFLNKKDLTKPDEKILDNLINSLGKKYGKKKGYQSMATLRDWVANKKGMRNKALIQAGIGDEALQFPKASIKRTRIQDLRAQQDAEDQHKKTQDAYIKKMKEEADLWWKRQQSKKDKKKDDWAEDTGIGFGPRTDKKKVRGRSPGDPFRKDKQLKKVTSASPTGTVYPGAKSKASAPTRRDETKYTIKPKDTLSDLAKDRGTTLAAIRRANPGRFPTAKSLNIIKAGEKINMPPNVGATTPYDAKTVRVKPKVVPTPKRKPTQKVSKEDQSVKLKPWSGGGELTVRPPLKPLEGGVRYKKLPDWLGGGEIKIDSTFEEEKGDNVTHGKKGGQVKKGVKKIKAKARRRAALRGHRAELRGG